MLKVILASACLICFFRAWRVQRSPGEHTAKKLQIRSNGQDQISHASRKGFQGMGKNRQPKPAGALKSLLFATSGGVSLTPGATSFRTMQAPLTQRATPVVASADWIEPVARIAAGAFALGGGAVVLGTGTVLAGSAEFRLPMARKLEQKRDELDRLLPKAMRRAKQDSRTSRASTRMYAGATPTFLSAQPLVSELREKREGRRHLNSIVIAPSVEKASVPKFDQDLAAVVEGGAQWLHFRVPDGESSWAIRAIIGTTRNAFPNTAIEVKIEGKETDIYEVGEFVEAGADVITFQPGSTIMQTATLINTIKLAGAAVGVILDSATPVSSIAPIIDQVDVVAIEVPKAWDEIGLHGGPKYEAAIGKIQSLRQLCEETGIAPPYIEAAAGMTPGNAAELIAAGANILVVGKSLFLATNKTAAIDSFFADSHSSRLFS